MDEVLAFQQWLTHDYSGAMATWASAELQRKMISS
jgi:hypothetical protein